MTGAALPQMRSLPGATTSSSTTSSTTSGLGARPDLFMGLTAEVPKPALLPGLRRASVRRTVVRLTSGSSDSSLDDHTYAGALATCALVQGGGGGGTGGTALRAACHGGWVLADLIISARSRLIMTHRLQGLVVHLRPGDAAKVEPGAPPPLDHDGGRLLARQAGQEALPLRLVLAPQLRARVWVWEGVCVCVCGTDAGAQAAQLTVRTPTCPTLPPSRTGRLFSRSRSASSTCVTCTSYEAPTKPNSMAE